MESSDPRPLSNWQIVALGVYLLGMFYVILTMPTESMLTVCGMDPIPADYVATCQRPGAIKSYP